MAEAGTHERAWLHETLERPLPRPWMRRYAEGLLDTGSHTHAACRAGVSRGHAWHCRRYGDIRFAQACWAALELWREIAEEMRREDSYRRALAWRMGNGDFRERGQWREDW